MRLLPLLSVLLLASCGGSPSAYCRAATDCNDGDRDDFDRCVRGMQDNYDDAADDGCLAEYDRYIDCVTRTSECRDDKLHPDNDCDDLKDDYEDCEG